MKSLLLGEWVLWLRGIITAVAGYSLARNRSFGAVAIALVAAYWAYKFIRLVVEFQTEILEEMGSGYVVRVLVALLMPFAFMMLGYVRSRKITPHKDLE
ncbi:MAG: hypothetical protein ACXW3Z_02895 [Limisphaerales bacterium]